MNQKKEPAAAGTPVEFQVFTEIAIIAHLADNAFAKVLPGGITTAQFGVLNHLTRLGTPQTITDIARAMQVAQPTMSSTVKKLVENGLVHLTPDGEDARIRKVALTDTGRAMRKRGIAAVAPLQALLAREIDAKTWQRLLPALSKVRRLLDDNR